MFDEVSLKCFIFYFECIMCENLVIFVYSVDVLLLFDIECDIIKMELFVD